jgi:ABC-2 type transport system permease protein
MTALLQLLRTDLVLYFSNRRAVLMSVAAPILIAAFFGYLFGNHNDAPGRMPIAIVDQDQSALSKRLIAAIEGDKLLGVQTSSESEGVALARAGKVRATVVIPPKFGEQAGSALFTARDKPELVLHYDPSQTAALQAVRGVLAQHVMQTVSQDAFSAASSTLPRLRADIAASTTMSAARRRDLTAMFDDIQRVQKQADDELSAGAADSVRPSLGLPYSVKEVEAVSGPDIPYNSYAHWPWTWASGCWPCGGWACGDGCVPRHCREVHCSAAASPAVRSQH